MRALTLAAAAISHCIAAGALAVVIAWLCIVAPHAPGIGQLARTLALCVAFAAMACSVGMAAINARAFARGMAAPINEKG